MSAPNQLSFLPDDYLARKAQRRTNVICATLFLIVLGVIAGVFTLSESATREVIKHHDGVAAEYTEFAKRIDQVKELREKQQKMAHQAEVTASLLERVPRSYLLAEFTNSMPPGVSLIDLSLDSRVRTAAPAAASTAGKTAFEQKKAELEAKANKPAAPAVPQAKVYDVGLKLTGVAQTDVQVAQFINKLSRSKLLTDVNLVVVDQYTVDSDKVRKFTLEMMMNPEATIDPAAKAMTKTAAVELQTTK